MLNINFEVGQQRYILKSSTRDFSLYRIRKVQDEESENFGNDWEDFVGYFANVFNMVRYLKDEHLLHPDISNFLELREEVEMMIKDIRELTEVLVAECYTTPEDLAKKSANLKKSKKGKE